MYLVCMCVKLLTHIYILSYTAVMFWFCICSQGKPARSHRSWLGKIQVSRTQMIEMRNVIAFVSNRSHATVAKKASIIWTSDFFQVIVRSLSSNSKILFSEVLHTTVECLKSLKIQGDTPETRVWPVKAHRHLCRMCYGKAKRPTWTMDTERKVICVVLQLNSTLRNLCASSNSCVSKDTARLAASAWCSPCRIRSTFANFL